MNKNFECQSYTTEKDTIKNCSKIEIDTILKKELARGAIGVIFPIIVKIGSKRSIVVVKKITTHVSSEKDIQKFIKNMYYEVEYSYKMSKYHIGPHVYDAFYSRNGNLMNQYIIMERFKTSIENWLLSGSKTLNLVNCTYVANEMLELLYKQIFDLKTYCCDIKVDNFVINTEPLKVRMIDFGVEWCSSAKLPNEFNKIKETPLVKKEIFYCLCVLQLYINIIHIGTPLPIILLILKSFYKDELFIKYVLKHELEQLEFKKQYKQKINFKKLLKNILKGDDQAITLSHYLRKNDKQSSDEIADYVFDKIKEITNLMF